MLYTSPRVLPCKMYFSRTSNVLKMSTKNHVQYMYFYCANSVLYAYYVVEMLIIICSWKEKKDILWQKRRKKIKKYLSVLTAIRTQVIFTRCRPIGAI